MGEPLAEQEDYCTQKKIKLYAQQVGLERSKTKDKHYSNSSQLRVLITTLDKECMR